MTLANCKYKICELIDNFVRLFKQPVGTTEEDIYHNKIYGFEEECLNRLNQKATKWNENTEYKVGDIVSYKKSIFISKKNYNVGATPDFNPEFWHKKTIKIYNPSQYISDYVVVRDNNIIDKSDNIDSISGTSYKRTVKFVNAYNTNTYIVLVNIKHIDGTNFTKAYISDNNDRYTDQFDIYFRKEDNNNEINVSDFDIIVFAVK